MRSFEIFVAPEPESVPRSESRDDAAPIPSSGVTTKPKHLAREVLDVFVGGANVTARIAERHASCVLRDFAHAVSELGPMPQGKRLVRFYDDAWELCIERAGASAALSVYRVGTEPSVTVQDARVPFADVVASARDAIAATLARKNLAKSTELELTACSQMLERAASLPQIEDATASFVPVPVSIDIDRDAPIAFAADFALRPGPANVAEPTVERTDLHALLFRGRARAEVRGRAIDLGDVHPFLAAERMLVVARRTMEAWERGEALHVRGDAGGALLGVRLTVDGALALTLGASRVQDKTRTLSTFPALGVPDFIESTLAFGRALVRAILRRDRSQGMNLRLTAFRRALRETGDALREACQEDAKINPSPEPYRAFAIARASTKEREEALSASKLRYSSRWRALVPGIDLRATFLCGDRLVVGAAAETFCLDRATGEVIWRVETERATSVVTPGGVARIHPDGLLAVHDFGTGEVALRTWLAPRLGGPVAGAVVNMQGLPRLLIVTEGERHLVAIDLTSGEPRWRYAWGARSSSRGSLRLKRAGKLLYVTCGDSALTALDVLTGAVVWRSRDRLRFRAAPTLDHDLLFAVAGGASGAAQLRAIDAFSGQPRWVAPVRPSPSGAPGSCTVEGTPLVASAASDVVALALRDRHGIALSAFDRDSGAPRWETAERLAPVGTSWIAVDDLFLGNTPTGEIVAVDAATGAVRYRRELGRVLEADLPRRLEPVLRSGALFVPHPDLPILRPRDGALLGSISPCDAIPDLLRVDERCDVYVAEESGHVGAFAAGPRLSLVRN